MLIRGGRDYWQQQSVEIITCKIILMALSCQQFELEIIHDGNLSSRGWMDVLSYSRVPFTQSVYQLLTLPDSQHQFHGFGSAHASVCVFQALQQACGGGWYAERERARIKAHIYFSLHFFWSPQQDNRAMCSFIGLLCIWFSLLLAVASQRQGEGKQARTVKLHTYIIADINTTKDTARVGLGDN